MIKYGKKISICMIFCLFCDIFISFTTISLDFPDRTSFLISLIVSISIFLGIKNYFNEIEIRKIMGLNLYHFLRQSDK